jgi:hypothetical protein
MHYLPLLSAAVSCLLPAVPAAQSYKVSADLEGEAREHVRSFVVDPGGTRVAFVVERFFDALYFASTDGSAPAQIGLDAGSRILDPAFAPDGSWLVFRTSTGDHTVVASRQPEPGSSVRILSRSERNSPGASAFAITPDGTRVIYIADQTNASAPADSFELFVAPIEGDSLPLQLVDFADATGDVLDFAVSPDSSWVVFRARETDTDAPGFYSVPCDGSVAPVRLDLPRPQALVQPDYTISPDSLGVAYRHDQDADELFELFVVRIDGSTTPLKRNGPLVPQGDVLSFAFAEGGLRLLYRADQDADGRFEIFTAPTFGGAAVRLSAPLVAGGSVREFRVAPDGAAVVYRADATTVGKVELFARALDGSPVVKLNAPISAANDVVDFQFSQTDALVYRSGAKLFRATLDGSPALALATQGFVSPGYLPSPDASRVTYVGDPDGELELFSIALAPGALPVQLNDPLRVPNPSIVFALAAGGRALYLAAEEHAFRENGGHALELHTARLDGIGPAAPLNPPLDFLSPEGDVFDFALTPDGEQVLYRANPLGQGPAELLRRSADGRGPAVRVHAVLGPQQGLGVHRVTSDSRRVVFRVTGTSAGLFSAPLDGSAPQVRLGPDLGGTIGEFVLSHDGAWVVYSSDQTGASEVFRAPTDGSAPEQELSHALLPGEVATVRARISADDAWVVYLVRSSSGTYELYSRPLDLGAPARRISGPMSAGGSVQVDHGSAAPISPDSTRVVYGADPDGNGVVELYSAPIDGGTAPVQLSTGGGLLFDAQLRSPFLVAPDSSRVAYFADPDGDGSFTLYSAPLLGGATPLALGPIALDDDRYEQFLLDADSSLVVYRGVGQLLAVPLDGSGPVRVLSSLPATGELFEFGLTPDATRAVYRASASSFAPRELHSVLLDGSAPPVRLHAPLPAGADVGVPPSTLAADVFQVTLDSRRVVFVADLREDGVVELFSAPLDGSAFPRLESGTMASGGGAVQSGGRTAFRLSPRGERVFYLADEEHDELFELFAGFLSRPSMRDADPERTVVR